MSQRAAKLSPVDGTPEALTGFSDSSTATRWQHMPALGPRPQSVCGLPQAEGPWPPRLTPYWAAPLSVLRPRLGKCASPSSQIRLEQGGERPGQLHMVPMLPTLGSTERAHFPHQPKGRMLIWEGKGRKKGRDRGRKEAGRRLEEKGGKTDRRGWGRKVGGKEERWRERGEERKKKK
ncbi:Hypothetical predicted protein [Marmota monax]|uniref:Uncharacterized protein n=1 Tax=Marmota monax TaxID=9995 RepID=A0A5E4BMJ7_MARMO|nr:Hypothetical predicted protein [Marmota monax]